MIDEFGDDYRQVLSLSAPPIESINPDRQITIDLARLANDSMADLVRAHPDRFPGLHRVAAAQSCRRERRGARAGGEHARRARRAGLLERQRPATRRRTLFSAVRDRRSAGLPSVAPPRARRRVRRTTQVRRSPSTRSGGRSAGRTRRARRCSGWCSPACSIACRASASSPIISAR